MPVEHSNASFAYKRNPQRSQWSCYLSGSPAGPVEGTVTYTPIEGGEPNWFHRLMMRLFFGFIWVKKAKTTDVDDNL